MEFGRALLAILAFLALFRQVLATNTTCDPNSGACQSERDSDAKTVPKPETQRKDYKIVCYYDAKLLSSDSSLENLLPNNIDPTLCTHIVIAFVPINNQSQIDLDAIMSNAYAREIISNTTELKVDNVHLKFLFSVGGWRYNSREFEQMALDDSLRSVFVRSAVDFVRKFDLDGLDIFPDNISNRGDPAFEDSKFYLIPLVKDLKMAFAPYNYSLSATLPATILSESSKTPIPFQVVKELAKYLDWINIKAFDLNGAWMHMAVHHSPLYVSETDRAIGILSVNDTVQPWLKAGIPTDKLLLGVSSYARSFKLKMNEKCPSSGLPITGLYEKASHTQQSGFMSYSELRETIHQQKWKYRWIADQQVPFAQTNWRKTSDLGWIGYEDVESIDAKVKYLMDKGFGGIMLFSLDNDDYNNIRQEFPLLRVANFHLNPSVKRQCCPQSYIIHAPSTESNQKVVTLATKYFQLRDEPSRNDLIETFCECKNGSFSVQRELPSASIDLPTGLEINCDNDTISGINSLEHSEENDMFAGQIPSHRKTGPLGSFFSKRNDAYLPGVNDLLFFVLFSVVSWRALF